MAGSETSPRAREETATVLLTEVERSHLWETMPDVAAAAMDRHYDVVVSAMHDHGAAQLSRIGEDGMLALFGSTASAATAALAVQRGLAAEEWPDGLAVRVRIGLYTGQVCGGDWLDHTEVAAQRGARLRDIARGGQTLLSAMTASLVADALPDGAWLADLGVHRLRDLADPEHVFELCNVDLAHGFAPLRPADSPPTNLPAQLTSFVGRRDELVEVRRLLATYRLVTLTGSGGCGKTRLAVQAAAESVHRWPDGVWWVDLGPVTDAALVPEVTASTMQVLVEPVGGPLRALVSQLRQAQLLVCLDTCEHVLDAAATLAETLVRSCSGVSILATSREPLGVTGEAVWRVPSLGEDEAVRLFTSRAALVRPGPACDADDDAVRVICRRLDGIPLAVELAAAWVRALTPAQIAAGMGDRFRMLTGGRRGVVARHRTLAASMQWSYDLLDQADRAVFRRLAVFAGGFTVDAARAVCAGDEVCEDDVLATVGRLIDKSLVNVQESNNEFRYRMLDTIQQYAQDRLRDSGELAGTRDRHLDHFLALAELAEPQLDQDQDRWRAALQAEHDNVRAALEWAFTAADPDRGRRLAAALARFWFLHGHTTDGLGFLQQAIDLTPDDRSPLQASLLSGLALVAFGGGQPALTFDAAARGLQIAVANADDRNRARCLVLSAYLPFFTDFAAAQELCQQAQRYAGAAHDQFAFDYARLLEACTVTNRDRHGEAVELVQRFVEPCLGRGERFCAAFGRAVEVWAALFGGDLRRADSLGVESLRMAAALGDYFTIGLTTFNLAWVKGLAGDVGAGRRLMEPIMRSIDHEGANVDFIHWLALMPGKLHLWSGDFSAAVTWLTRATRFAEPMTDNWITARALPGLAGALRRLGRVTEARAAADRAIALATAMDIPHVLAEALEEAAFLAAPDDPAGAEDLHHQALAVRVEHGLRTFYVDSLEALAVLATRWERFDPAVHLLAACDAARDRIGYPRPATNQPDHESTVAAARAAVGDEGFVETWARGGELSLDDAVAYARRARGPRGRPSHGWASLTPTELDVVRLVADGLTNPEVGKRLFITRATVKTHLSHIYAKLGVANRTGLATIAAARRPGDEIRRAGS